MATPNVPFKRILKVDDKGDDVIAVKIVASRAGFWPWAEFDDIAHAAFMNGSGKAKKTSGLKGLQRWLGVTADGVYGPVTHSKSLPRRVPRGLVHGGEFLWDGHSQALYRGAVPTDHAAALVKSIATWWQWMISRQAPIHYSQVRPMRELALHHSPPRLPMYSDCSSTFIYAAFLAGAKSPDIAYGYSGYGNTASLVSCGQSISEGDIPRWAKDHYVGVYYGNSVWSTHHVSAALPRVASMGNENAPEWWSSIHDGPGPIAAIKAHAVI